MKGNTKKPLRENKESFAGTFYFSSNLIILSGKRLGQLIKRACNMRQIFRTAFLFALCISFQNARAQQAPLDIIYGLIDSSAAQISRDIPDNINITPELNMPDGLQALRNYAFSKLKGLGKSSDSSKTLRLDYTILEAKTDYVKLKRKSFFGDYAVEREITLKGNYLAAGNDSLCVFSFIYKDEIDPDTAASLENPLLPFTRDEMPETPFLSNITEPAVAIAAAAVTVILFFTARSK
jgi:hypothetical protein